MFSNLIESSSHGSEFRRRGSFLLFTTASYAAIFVIAGVVSIYAYDARMENRSLELVTMMPLVDLPSPEQPPVTVPASKPTNPTNQPNNNKDYHQREVDMADVDEPTIVPDGISTKANVNLPRPKTGVVGRGPDSNPGPGNSGNGSGGQPQSNSAVVVPIDTQPPVPVQTPVPQVIRKPILNGEAKFLPKPPYPEMAKQMKIQGVVNVQVLVDETGRVVSAKAVSGHALLAREAQKAAFQARFSPTIFGDQAVKVSGVISYNFVLQQ